MSDNTIYEFNILEMRTARDDDSEQTNPNSPKFEPDWQAQAGGLTFMSRDGWELVSVELQLNRFTSEHGNPRTEQQALSVWRRPVER